MVSADNQVVVVKTEAVQVRVIIDDDGHALLSAIHESGLERGLQDNLFPLVEVRVMGEGNDGVKTAKSLVGSSLARRLKYVKHIIEPGDKWTTLKVVMEDAAIGIRVTSSLTLLRQIPVVRSRADVENISSTECTLTQVSSFVIGAMTRKSRHWWSENDLWVGENTWYGEARWIRRSLPDVGLDEYGFGDMGGAPKASFAHFSLSNRSTFSTEGHLPMGLLMRNDEQDCWLWQVEQNGAWRWDIGDWDNSIYLATSGPEAANHEWRLRLEPGQSFQTCYTAVCHVKGGVDEAFSHMTRYRRAIIRPHADYETLPIIFNDYMNCLSGDPNEEKILALLDPVVKTGAEFFVIDAGWYADDSNWWDDVGEWRPSIRRFPNGFANLIHRIKAKGLTPGLWIEPGVIGVKSHLAQQLPDHCFFQREGKRIVERQRYHLDFRHKDVRARMSGVIDSLIRDYGIGYFKFDYNIEHVLGTDFDCYSSGVGQDEHGRAYLGWVSDLLDRHPGLVIENCSSGGMRMEYAMLAIHTVQSTSDQQDPILYAAIAAALPTAVIPEQSATWAYPQGEWSDEKNAMTMANTLLGRMCLSGRQDRLSSPQSAIVLEALAVYRQIRLDLREAVPFWPLGLPKWHDDWLALGMSVPSKGLAYVLVWRRGAVCEATVPIKLMTGSTNVNVELLFPAAFPTTFGWSPTENALKLRLPSEPCARLFSVKGRQDSGVEG